MGEYESFNFSICLQSDDIALFHALYRTSLKGRKDIVKLMFTDEDNDEAISGVIDDSYTSRVSEIFGVIMKCLGIEVKFLDEEKSLKPYDNETIKPHELDGHCYMCTNYQFFLIERLHSIREDILRENQIITDGELRTKIEEEMRKRKYITGTLEDEVGIIDLAGSLLMSDEDYADYKNKERENDLGIDFSEDEDDDNDDSDSDEE